jgi:hypothetical protein
VYSGSVEALSVPAASLGSQWEFRQRAAIQDIKKPPKIEPNDQRSELLKHLHDLLGMRIRIARGYAGATFEYEHRGDQPPTRFCEVHVILTRGPEECVNALGRRESQHSLVPLEGLGTTALVNPKSGCIYFCRGNIYADLIHLRSEFDWFGLAEALDIHFTRMLND